MNYDCNRPTSKVSQPPGGGTSNIFGTEDVSPKASSKKATNPSFHSTIFSDGSPAVVPQLKAKSDSFTGDCQLVQQKVENQRNDRSMAESVLMTEVSNSQRKQDSVVPKCKSVALKSTDATIKIQEKTICAKGARKLSNIPMFDCDKRPATAPPSRGNQLNRRSNASTVFNYANYPINPKTEPGVSRRPHTAYKPANANTKSSIYWDDHNIPKNEMKTSNDRNVSNRSTVFDPDPKQVVMSRPVSRTYQCSIDDPAASRKFLKQKRSLKNFNESAMIGCTCDVAGKDAKPVVMSSDIFSSTLKPNKAASFSKPNDPIGKNEFVLSRSSDDVIIPCGDSVVHLPRQTKKEVSSNFISDGFKDGSAIKNTPSATPTVLWSSGTQPAKIKSGNPRQSKNFQSQIFSLDNAYHVAPIWSSDFKQAPMQSERKTVVNKTLRSTVFAANKDVPSQRKPAVSKNFTSTVFAHNDCTM